MSRPESISSFIEMTTNLDSGTVRQELDDALAEAVRAIKDFGGKAEIIFKVVIEKSPGFEDVIVITDDIKVKLPKEKRSKSLMFTTHDNMLVMQRQDQIALDLEFVESTSKRVFEIAESSRKK